MKVARPDVAFSDVHLGADPMFRIWNVNETNKNELRELGVDHGSTVACRKIQVYRTEQIPVDVLRHVATTEGLDRVEREKVLFVRSRMWFIAEQERWPLL